MRSRRASPAAVLVAVAVSLGGCGDSGARRDAAADAAVGLLTAVHDRDGTAACVLLAPSTIAALEQSMNVGCAEAILDENLPEPGTVRRVDVYGQWARVVLDDDTLFLAVFRGGWRVASGCRPLGERPYDCVLQGG
ncbi:hypothetical protein OHA72_46815 [Dactylosporangium sp. NBC_01737]|uniref:hypothetical protein n=1 Tax=Dactylosporangium sp. NBC_01737 TaxID=2975959 RepID=UPI002E12B6CF|nr:hypothetical protein OHA72_46815 [Dactylosporangium sp. NBC_01737]